MTASSDLAATASSISPIEAFRGTIARTKTKPLYSAGLGLVAFAMVLLPLIYVALIVLTACLVLLHLRYDAWIFEGGSGGVIIKLIFYLGPAVAGGILVFFMVKPFFATKTKQAVPITLDPAKEPLLFAFVQKICTLVGAPEPRCINVDCQVNASASLRHGFWSRELVLTIGLPLISGLNMREFAGVLAHEFGHFAQGAGMRLTYIIRKINFWFARVVYERDQWDVQLARASNTSDWRIRIVLLMARGCVWLTRRILWALMQVGHAISCFMLRQMEYDADSYEAKLAGSDAFETTARQLRLLNVATQAAYQDVRQSWASNRLPENLPLLINHKAGSLPLEIQQKLATTADAQKTRWSDTHPCDADRTREAKRLNEPGVFALAEPATALFSDFVQLSKAVTKLQYVNHGLQFNEQNLIAADELLRESAASAETAALVRKYYGSVNVSLKPLLTTTELQPLSTDENVLEKLPAARVASETLRAEAEKLSAECEAEQERRDGLNSVVQLVGAGFKVPPKQFGLSENANSPARQGTFALAGIKDASAAIALRLTRLEPFFSVLRARVTLGLNLAQAIGDKQPSGESAKILEFVRLLVAVSAEIPRAKELSSKLTAFGLLAQNRGNHANPGRVDQVLSKLAAEMQSITSGLQERLKGLNYPFPHARGTLTVAEYARSELPAQNEWHRAHLDAGAHVERLFALHYQLLGRVLAYAAAGEASVVTG